MKLFSRFVLLCMIGAAGLGPGAGMDSKTAEEVQRLRSHVSAARELIAVSDAPTGKQLDFLAQELMREANTVGSKAQDAEAIREVVGLKAEIERFREQVQNVE